ncbi:MAG: hypothetical protein JXD19_04785 [Deltaproteobacteria bacterium]|nr:hypothetical protein [Deltaproteobacteria bacterium]
MPRTLFVKEKLDGYNFVGFIPTHTRDKQIVRGLDERFAEVYSYEIFNLVTDFRETSDLFRDRSRFSFKSVAFKTHTVLAMLKESASQSEPAVDYRDLDPANLQALKALGYIR